MNLKTKQLDFVAEKISIISTAIKEGKERELPEQIFHHYKRGGILIGINGILIIEIDGEYKKVDDDNYLLMPSGCGGESKILKNFWEIKYHFVNTDSSSL